MKLAVVATHPTQYTAPLFRLLANEPGVEFTALFCHDHGVEPTLDRQFGKVIRYDVPLLDGYEHEFLRNVSPRRGLSFAGLLNPGALRSHHRSAYDAMVVFGYNTLTSLLLHLSPRSATRVLLRGESCLLPHRGAAKRSIKRPLLRGLFGRIDHFLTAGTANRAYYEHYGVPAHRITLAPYSVDNDYFRTGSEAARGDRATVRAELGLPANVPIFLFCAKAIQKKRPLDALRAFARVRRNTPCAMVYVGDGELAPEIAREIEVLGLSSDVYWLGFRNQSQLPKIYGACDVLVLPSENEPWGLVVNEAMAAGMAVIVSDHVGAGPDLVEPDCVYPAGDVDALAAVMQRFALSGSYTSDVRSRSADRVERFSLRRTADGFLRGADAAIGSRSPMA